MNHARTLVLVAFVFAAPLAVAADKRPDGHAPIEVMADHTHKDGEWMVSYRVMHMHMEGNRQGESRVSPAEIATTAPNRFAGTPMMPPTLRVVPTEMRMTMQMLGLMYAPNDRVTLMAMLNHIDKEMEHLTFAGPMGTQTRGTFTTRTSGFGDTQVQALVGLYDAPDARIHLNVGVSLPTGDLEERDQVLTPMGTTPVLRLPYPMQLGSGTYDAIAGLTAVREWPRWSAGAQWRGLFRIGENDEDYTLGDEHNVQAWVSRRVGDAFSVSLRVSHFDRGNIDGIDPLIRAPVQTADPDRQGAERTMASLGVNWVAASGHRLALEAGRPIRQRLDGPQLETDWQITLGWQYSPH